MQNMSVMLKKTPVSDMTNHILPMIHQSLEANNSQLQVHLLIICVKDSLDIKQAKNSCVYNYHNLNVQFDMFNVY